ncbi:hypothetical protein Agub_g12426 [Astrephomene gubernaculifera]|uniref:U-box domain-containing protein n=1 Tax=Astrephomene gubernaculifera TaxID=47775 RepID=A0AAD3HRS5_9CHLO|nr:hypothetical protein Agub_g12426 [Astrephomene gubernaculifera]
MASHQKVLESATSLERFLNRSVIFVQGIDPNASKSEIVQVLNQAIKQPQQGGIDILTTPEGKNRGTAFLNFSKKEDAKTALEKWRFGLELRGRPLKIQYSSDREFKDVLQSPLVARFKVLIRNLPEELDPPALYDKYSAFGEIIQVHTNQDHYGQYFAIIQYVEVASVARAIQHTNRQRVYNNVLMVEPYKPNASYGPIPRNFGAAATPNGTNATGAAASSSSSTAAGAAAGGGSGPSARVIGGHISAHQGITYAALQQQQERELQEQEQEYLSYSAGSGGAAAAAGATQRATADGTSGGGAAAAASSSSPVSATAAATAAAEQRQQSTGSGMLPVPSFYAAPPASPPVHSLSGATGSLQGLLTAALTRAHLLEELLCCPITQEPLVDPVLAADGNTYERIAIEAWLANHDTSPLTNQVLSTKLLTPNNLVRKIAEELKGSGPAGSGLDEQDAAAGSFGEAEAAPDVFAATMAQQQTTTLVAVSSDSGTAAAREAAVVRVAVPIPVPTAAAPTTAQQQQQEQQQQPAVTAESQSYYTTAPQQQQSQHPVFGIFRHHASQQQQQQLQPHPVLVQIPQLQHQQQVHYTQAQPQQYQYQIPAASIYGYRPMGM